MFDWVWTISPVAWFAVAVGTGFALILAGWIGRRVGNELRCRRCAYILAELPTPICPECGLDSARRRPRRGLRRVRKIPLIGGALVLLTTISPAIWLWQNANWRGQAPLWLILTAMDFGDGASQQELVARLLLEDVITGEQLRGVTSRALDAQRDAPPESMRLTLWLEAIEQMDKLNLLTDDEWDRMIQQCVREVGYKMRARCRADRPLPFQLDAVTAIPRSIQTAWRVRMRTAGAQAWFVDSSVWGALPHTAAVGRHQVTVELRGTLQQLNAFRASQHDLYKPLILPSKRAEIAELEEQLRRTGGGDPVVNEKPRALNADLKEPVIVRTLEGELEVTPADSDADLDIIRGPAARDKLELALRPALMRVERGERDEGVIEVHYEPTVRLEGTLPWLVAFDLNVRVDGAERAVAKISARAGATSLDRELVGIDWREHQGKSVTLVLRPDPEPGRKTIDLTFVDETLELGPIVIGPP